MRGIDGGGVEHRLAVAVDADHAGVVALATIHELRPQDLGQGGLGEEVGVIVQQRRRSLVLLLQTTPRVVDRERIVLVEVQLGGGEGGAIGECAAHGRQDRVHAGGVVVVEREEIERQPAPGHIVEERGDPARVARQGRAADHAVRIARPDPGRAGRVQRQVLLLLRAPEVGVVRLVVDLMVAHAVTGYAEVGGEGAQHSAPGPVARGRALVVAVRGLERS